jgi:hypothetical protein
MLRSLEGDAVHFTSGADVASLLEAGRAAGLRCLRIDLAGCSDKAGLLGRLADALEFPGWFGQNWDALADCLGDLEWLPADGYLLVLEGADELRQAAPRDYWVALEILAETARAWRERQVPFRVFINATKDEA